MQQELTNQADCEAMMQFFSATLEHHLAEVTSTRLVQRADNTSCRSTFHRTVVVCIDTAHHCIVEGNIASPSLTSKLTVHLDANLCGDTHHSFFLHHGLANQTL